MSLFMSLCMRRVSAIYDGGDRIPLQSIDFEYPLIPMSFIKELMNSSAFMRYNSAHIKS